VDSAVLLTPKDARKPAGKGDDLFFGVIWKRNVEKFVDEGVEALVL
jgi:hypothetical protein